MTHRVRLLAPAREEIGATARWYESKRDGLGVEFVAMLDEALGALATRPMAARVWCPDRDYRAKPLRRFPYIVFYRIVGEEVVIVAVAHEKRQPGYWADR